MSNHQIQYGKHVDIAIITALEMEARAVVSRLKNPTIERFEEKDIRTYHRGLIPIQNTDQTYKVVVITLPNMGTIPAAIAVTDLINQWHPHYIFMVGIAGGIPQDDLELGDVVVADQVVGYDYGKITDEEIKPRDRVYPVSSLLLDRIRNHWDSSWTNLVDRDRPNNARRSRSKVFIGPIMSGNKVIASAKFQQQLLEHWPKLIAVEMESEGVLAAVFDRPQIHATLVVRGICDMSNKSKSDKWQEYAANAAAAFVVGFLKTAPIRPLQRLKRANSTTSVLGLSTDFYNRLRQILLNCGVFESDHKLHVIFSHPLLKPWQDNLCQADNASDRVDGLISLLLYERNNKGENALILFLQILCERIDPTIERHDQLTNLINDLTSSTKSNSANIPERTL